MRKQGVNSSQQVAIHRSNSNNVQNGNSASNNTTHLLQVDTEFRCSIKDHQRERIEFICTYKECTAENRLCCTFCKQLFHGGHQKEKVIKLKDFSSKVVVDAEKLTKRFEEMVDENDIKIIFQQRLQKTIKEKLDDLVKLFQRQMKIARDRISVIIESSQDVYEQAENQDICDDIYEFNSELYKILHRSYKLHTKEDIEMLTKIYRNESYCEYLSNSKSISRNKFFYFANDRLDQYVGQLTVETDNLVRDLSGQIKKMEENFTQNGNDNKNQSTLPKIGRNTSETRVNQRNGLNNRPYSNDRNKSTSFLNNSQAILQTEPSMLPSDTKRSTSQTKLLLSLKRDQGQNNGTGNVKSLLNSISNQGNNSNHHPVMQRNGKNSNYKTVKFDRNQLTQNTNKLNLNECILLLDFDNSKKQPSGSNGQNQIQRRTNSQNLNDSLLSFDNHESNMPVSPFKDSNSKNNASFSILKELHPLDINDSAQNQNGVFKETGSPQQRLARQNSNLGPENRRKRETFQLEKDSQSASKEYFGVNNDNSQNPLPVYKIRDLEKENKERNQPFENWIPATQEEIPDIKHLTEAADKQIGEFQYILPSDHVEQDLSQISIMKNVEACQIYNGQWKDGLRHGKGLCILNDGSVYVGYWKNNYANGYGRIVHPNGNIYEGDWLNGKTQGKGIYHYPNGTKYEGEWADDLYDGYGVKSWNNGSKYEGYYRKGYRDGKGIFTWPDGSSYSGYFYKNQIHGQGHYKWNDGREYIGEWSNGKMNGSGYFRWPDNRIYKGNYFNDQKEGYGDFYWPNNEKTYQGNWSKDQPHGIGYITQKNGQKTKGEWQQGKHIRWIADSEDTTLLEQQQSQNQNKPKSK